MFNLPLMFSSSDDRQAIVIQNVFAFRSLISDEY